MRGRIESKQLARVGFAARKVRVLAPAFAIMTIAGGLFGQVAGQANSGYQTESGRKGVAKTLTDPNREDQQKPRELVVEMGLQPGMTVADIGTGVGYMLPYLSRRVGPAGRVIAEDIFDDFLSAAKTAAENQGLKNVSFVKGTEIDPNLGEGQLDMALVLDSYHHFNYPEKMLASIRRALKPDGKLVVVEYYKRESAMPNGRALTHIRLDMPDAIKEIENNQFHLIMEREHVKNVQYMLILEKSS